MLETYRKYAVVIGCMCSDRKIVHKANFDIYVQYAHGDNKIRCIANLHCLYCTVQFIDIMVRVFTIRRVFDVSVQ